MNSSRIISFAEYVYLEESRIEVSPLTHRNRKASDYETEIARKIHGSGWGADEPTATAAGFDPNMPDYRIRDVDGNHHNLEIKSGHSSMFGQIALEQHPEHGWVVSSDTKKKKPNTSAYIERSGILHRLNHEWGPLPEGAPRKDINHDAPNGAEGVNLHYGSDKHTPYIHIKDHGMFHTSNDSANLGTPQLSGNFSLRARHKKIRTNADGTHKYVTLINFHVKKQHLPRSPLSLDADIPAAK
jgi:hypothetical protein